MNRKQLHKHALPIIILCSSMFIVSIIGLNHLVFAGSPSNGTIGHLLTERFIRVTPARSGLFHVSRYQSNDVADSHLSLDTKPTAITGISNTGKVAQLQITLNSLVQTEQQTNN